MNDDLLKRLLIRQKLVANPKEVLFVLLVERDARLYSSMDKEEISTAKMGPQFMGQELQVSGWQAAG